VDQAAAVDHQIIPQDSQALQDKVMQEGTETQALLALEAVEVLVVLEAQEHLQQVVMAEMELLIRLLDHL
jgi:hypothetical protein